ncbi:MAG TPA: hypothetical protein VH933_13550 [Aestuariivirgaceae bacterium]
MKVSHWLLIVTLAGIGLVSAPTGPVKAEHRSYWLPPGYFPPPPPPRRHYWPRYWDPGEDEYGYYEDDYDEPYYSYDEDDFEPPYKPPRRKKSKAAAAYQEPDDSQPSTVPKIKKKPAAKSKAAKKPSSTPKTVTAKTTPETATPKIAAKSTPQSNTAGSVSCDKAKSIVSGYGFGNVEAKSCSGETYSFSAQRGGKNFSITVSALSGELTEVKRQ